MTPDYSTVSLATLARGPKGWTTKKPDNITLFIAVNGSAALWLGSSERQSPSLKETVVSLGNTASAVFLRQRHYIFTVQRR